MKEGINMDRRVKRTLFLLFSMIIVYPIIIYLAIDFPNSIKAPIHMAVSAIYLILLFRIWSSFKNATRKQWIQSVFLAVSFAVLLPIGIELVMPFSIMVRGIVQFVLVFLFVGLFIRVWLDPSKQPKRQSSQQNR